MYSINKLYYVASVGLSFSNNGSPFLKYFVHVYVSFTQIKSYFETMGVPIGVSKLKMHYNMTLMCTKDAFILGVEVQ